jgi:hypothetical protein
MMVQAAGGRLHYLDGRNLPNFVPLHTRVPCRGAHVAEVLLSPKDARATLFLANQRGWRNKWNALFFLFGVLLVGLIVALAQALG